MTELAVIISLLLFIFIREYIMWKEMQKLVDKLISRDYAEYTSGLVDIEMAKKKKPQDLSPMIRI